MNAPVKLVAEVIKRWRSDPEERALGEYILEFTKLSLSAAQSMTVEELTAYLNGVLEPQVQQLSQPTLESNTQSEIQQESQEQTPEETLSPELPQRIIELRKRAGRVSKK